MADAELELVPNELRSHTSIVKTAKNRGKPSSQILLDSSLHHSALKMLEDGNRRGRPEIAHLFLLIVLDSVLNARKGLNTIIHTRNNEVIRFDPETSVPRNYNRFVGLMEDLYQRRSLPPEKPLISIRDNTTLEDLVAELKADRVITLSPRGRIVELDDFFRGLKGHVAAIIGGFPEGDFTSPAEKLADDIVSVFPEPLTVWTVVSEVLVHYTAIHSKSFIKEKA